MSHQTCERRQGHERESLGGGPIDALLGCPLGVFSIYIQTSLRVQQNLKPSDFPMFLASIKSSFFWLKGKKGAHERSRCFAFVCGRIGGARLLTFQQRWNLSSLFDSCFLSFAQWWLDFTAGAMRFFWPYNCCTWECAFAFGRGNCSYETLQQDDELMRYCTMWHFAIQCVEGSLNRAFIKNSVKLTYPKNHHPRHAAGP